MQYLGMHGLPANGYPYTNAGTWYNVFIDGATKIARIGVVGVGVYTTPYYPTFNLACDILF
jgi:hypothetical protein